MQTGHPRKVIKLLSTLLHVVTMYIPRFGIDLAREFFRTSRYNDEFIKSFNEKADGRSMFSGLVSLLTRKGFPALEKRTG